MIKKTLSVERFQTKKDESTGYYSFGVEIDKSKRFLYYQSNPEQKETIKIFKNNFSSVYEIEDKDNQTKYIAFSTEGLSTFNSSWQNRQDIHLSRNSSFYRRLERLENLEQTDKTLLEIENILEKILSSNS